MSGDGAMDATDPPDLDIQSLLYGAGELFGLVCELFGFETSMDCRMYRPILLVIEVFMVLFDIG